MLVRLSASDSSLRLSSSSACGLIIPDPGNLIRGPFLRRLRTAVEMGLPRDHPHSDHGRFLDAGTPRSATSKATRPASTSFCSFSSPPSSSSSSSASPTDRGPVKRIKRKESHLFSVDNTGSVTGSPATSSSSHSVPVSHERPWSPVFDIALYDPRSDSIHTMPGILSRESTLDAQLRDFKNKVIDVKSHRSAFLHSERPHSLNIPSKDLDGGYEAGLPNRACSVKLGQRKTFE